MSLPPYSHEAPHACIADLPIKEEQIEQNEHGSDALTNVERVTSCPYFLQIPGQDNFQ